VNVLVCIKRVPQTGGRIVLTADGQAIDTRFLGFTISPHEECGVEEAVRIVEATGGSSTVLTLGPAAAEDQLRDAMALGIARAILLETDGSEWDPVSTAAAIPRPSGPGGRRASTCRRSATGRPTAAASGRHPGRGRARPSVVTGFKGSELGDGRRDGRRERPAAAGRRTSCRCPRSSG
jgi:electron transfer flavoprotein beta subunit